MAFKVNFDLAVDGLSTIDKVQAWLSNVRKIDQELFKVTKAELAENGWPNITASINVESDLQARYVMSYIYDGDLANPLELDDWANILVQD